MQGLRQLGGGLILGLLSILIILGGMSLALAEGYVPPPPPTVTETQPAPTSAPTEMVGLSSPIPTFTFTVTASLVPPISCLPPFGWILVQILPGDSLEILAARYATTPAALMAGNCLISNMLLPGYGIYVPSPPTITLIPCGAPFGWVQYIVQPNDNLYRISLLYRVDISQLQQANCLGTSTTIIAGQRLWVPNVATSTPPATPINIEFPTETLTPTDTPPIPTNTIEPIPSETPAPSETPPPTETPAPTETPTPPTP